MSAAAKAAPKTFNQLRLAAQLSVATFGCFTGYYQRQANDKLWDAHFKAMFAKKAAEDAARHPVVHSDKLPEGVPEELAELVQALRQ